VNVEDRLRRAGAGARRLAAGGVDRRLVVVAVAVALEDERGHGTRDQRCQAGIRERALVGRVHRPAVPEPGRDRAGHRP
jgi:hypothetical protein